MTFLPGQPGPAGNADAVFLIDQRAGGMGVGIDRQLYSHSGSLPGQSVVQVEVVRIAVDFHDLTIICSRLEKFFPIGIGTPCGENPALWVWAMIFTYGFWTAPIRRFVMASRGWSSAECSDATTRSNWASVSLSPGPIRRRGEYPLRFHAGCAVCHRFLFEFPGWRLFAPAGCLRRSICRGSVGR